MEVFEINNQVKLGGEIISDLEFSHEVYDEKFYKCYVKVERLSDSADVLPVIVSERMMDLSLLKIGTYALLEGQFRSYNQANEEKNRLVLTVFARTIELSDQETTAKLNEIVLEGFICKKPIYRVTPLGREIADVLVAVNRSYKKSDYIPCILWGRNAKFSSTLEVGSKVRLTGRVQSREYEKKNIDGTAVKHMAYEVSVSKFSTVKSEE